MTFIPLLGYYLLRPKTEPSDCASGASPASRRFTTASAARHRNRWKVLLASLVFLAFGGVRHVAARSSSSSRRTCRICLRRRLAAGGCARLPLPKAPRARRRRSFAQVAQEYGEPDRDGTAILVTTFVGGGGPRFWFSVSPELQQLNYAQLIIQVKDKHDTGHLTDALQEALSATCPGARIDVRQLETGKPVGMPVQIRISGEDMDVLRAHADRVKQVFRASPLARRVRDDWGEENVRGEACRSIPIARTSPASQISTWRPRPLRESTAIKSERCAKATSRSRSSRGCAWRRDRSSPISGTCTSTRVPEHRRFRCVRSRDVAYTMETEKLRRRNQFRTITVAAFPKAGVLPSEVLGTAMPRSASDPSRASARLQDGDRRRGEGAAEGLQRAGAWCWHLDRDDLPGAGRPVPQRDQAVHRVRGDPVRHGRRGSALWIMGAPFGFMAFLGVVSLVGVIVSHIIVLFDFIEEKHAEGEPLERGAARRRNHAAAPGTHHRRRHRDRALPARIARRTAVGAAMLRANRRSDGGDIHYASARAGDLRDLRARPEAGQMGARESGRNTHYDYRTIRAGGTASTSARVIERKLCLH